MNKQYAPNGIGHFDIGGPDAAALGSFYAGMFGWQVASRGPDGVGVHASRWTRWRHRRS